MTEHGLKAQSPLDELEGLALPQASFMVMGSGILDVLGIRKANDVDLVVSEEVFEQLYNANELENHKTNKNYLYVTRMIIYYAKNGREPSLLKWNNWKD